MNLEQDKDAQVPYLYEIYSVILFRIPLLLQIFKHNFHVRIYCKIWS